MIRAPKSLLGLSLAMLLAVPAHKAWSVHHIDAEDQKLIDAASCPDITREYRNYYNAEKEAEAQIRRSNAGQAAVNIAGLAAFATLGFGFFHWDSNASAQENLEEVRAIRVAIQEAARKKKCAL